jgi:ABC-2 type transport system permease protein
MRRILFIVQKEFRQILRVRAYFILIFAAPFIQLLVMGSAITVEVKNVPITLLDHDRSPASRDLLNAFLASGSFRLVGLAASENQVIRLLDRGKVKVAVIIPPHFERDLRNGRAPQLQVLIDGVDGNSAGVSLGYVQGLVAQVERRWAAAPARMEAAARRIEAVPSLWYNPELDSKLNFVPGLIAILLIMVTTFLTATNIVREKEMGTFEQLMVTPVSGIQLIIGKIIPFTILAFLQFTVGMLASGLVFGIWVKGSLLLLYGMMAIFCLSTLGLGIFISTVANTQQQAMFITWFFSIFAILLSGFFVPIENTPPFVRVLTYINPMRYFITVMRAVYLKGTELRFLWKEATAMGVIGAIALVSAAARFHKRLK